MGIVHQIITQNVHLLKVSEPLVNWRAEAVERQLAEAKELGAEKVMIDLTDVSFMDSRGLAALIKGLRIFGRDGDNIQLIAPQTQPALLLNLTGFDRIVPVIAPQEAVKTKRPQQSVRRLRSDSYPILAAA
jgi:anti-anti-sigma factor